MSLILEANPAKERALRILALLLGVFSFTTMLAVQHYADGDMWAKLALGAHVWLRGSILPQDVFAFTPVLPTYIDHEWGAGWIFYALLKWFGPSSLMVLKLSLALGAMAGAMAAARRIGTDWSVLLLLAIPCAACIYIGYVPVVRSHAFTYCFFGVTLFCLETMRRGGKWPAFVLPPLMLVWTNVHGGFVSGLCTIGVYGGFALLERLPMGRFFRVESEEEKHTPPMVYFIVLAACVAVTFVNPYGIEFWRYLIPALLHKRLNITEWRPLPFFEWDAFTPFRILFVIAVFFVVVAWRRTEKKSWPGLVMLVITAVLAWRSRRHASFFGVATLAFLGPFVATSLMSLAGRLPARLKEVMQPAMMILVVHAVIAGYVASSALPRASLQVLAPVGLYPVREVDILMHAKAEGNLAVPFTWGSYAAWRLHPQVKISMDGRYETTFPETTFVMNEDFCNKYGADWDRLLREHVVDYIILDTSFYPLRPKDLLKHGYDMVWVTQDHSALVALRKHAAGLRKVAAELPPTTIEPLDAKIPERWWSK